MNMAASSFTNEDRINPIYCRRCRKHIPRRYLDSSGYCPDCRQIMQMVAKTATITRNVPRQYNTMPLDPLLKTKPAKLPKKYRTFNFGAFGGGVIWAFAHQMYAAAILILIGSMLTSGILGIAGCIYLGVKGNELAWESRNFDDIQDFLDCQRAWTMFAIIPFIVFLASSILLFIVAIGLFSIGSM